LRVTLGLGLLGDREDVKSALKYSLGEQRFRHDYKSVIGMDIWVYRTWVGGHNVAFSCRDISSADRFTSMLQTFLRGCHIILLVVNSSAQSLDQVQNKYLPLIRSLNERAPFRAPEVHLVEVTDNSMEDVSILDLSESLVRELQELSIQCTQLTGTEVASFEEIIESLTREYLIRLESGSESIGQRKLRLETLKALLEKYLQYDSKRDLYSTTLEDWEIWVHSDGGFFVRSSRCRLCPNQCREDGIRHALSPLDLRSYLPKESSNPSSEDIQLALELLFESKQLPSELAERLEIWWSSRCPIEEHKRFIKLQTILESLGLEFSSDSYFIFRTPTFTVRIAPRSGEFQIRRADGKANWKNLCIQLDSSFCGWSSAQVDSNGLFIVAKAYLAKLLWENPRSVPPTILKQIPFQLEFPPPLQSNPAPDASNEANATARDLHSLNTSVRTEEAAAFNQDRLVELQEMREQNRISPALYEILRRRYQS
jgi:GTPase SAR1 family protein